MYLKRALERKKSEIKTFYETKGIVDFVLNFFSLFCFLLWSIGGVESINRQSSRYAIEIIRG